MNKTRVRQYGYGRIEKLAEKLAEAGITQELRDRIIEGGGKITAASGQETKADWMAQAMERMDKLLEKETRCAIRESCACCLGGKRLMLSKAIARNHATFEDRIKAANGTPFVFGHSVTLMDNGKVRVSFSPKGRAEYRCVCLRKASKPISITYCYCCGGHVKHRLQIALGSALKCQVVSSALSSGGKKPCTFEFTRVAEK